MDQETEQEEIKPLIFNYIFHFILFILILILHIIMFLRIYWIYDSLSIIFQFATYINIIYLLFPIIPFVFIIKKNYKKKLFISIKLFTLIFIIITVVFGLMISIIMLVNSLQSKTFCRECPFNLNLEYLNEVLGPYYGKTVSGDDIKDKCNSRRCVLDSENDEEEFPDLYLCNYDPSDEFNKNEMYKRQFNNGTEITSNKQIKCYTVTPNYNNIYEFNHLELNYYLDLCYYYADFYRCSRFNKPKKYNNLYLDIYCPETNYLILIYILCVLVIIMDLIISLLPWGVEFMSLKRILNLLNVTRRKVNSHNSTERSSQISNNEEDFKREKTPILIFPSNDFNNNNNNLRLNFDNDNNNNNIILHLNKNITNSNYISYNEAKENENIKETSKINNLKLLSSERNELRDKNIELDVNESMNFHPLNRNKFNNKKVEQSTTINSHQVKPLEIKINNEISNNKI